MNRVKLCLFPVIVFLLFVLSNEFYLWNIDNFTENYISTPFKLYQEPHRTDSLEELTQTAHLHNLEVFAVERDIQSYRHVNFNIYGNEAIYKTLAERSSVKEGSFNSLLLGNIEVNYIDFADYIYQEGMQTYYLIGDIEDAREFKAELISKYDGSFPHEGDVSFDASKNMVIVWVVSIAFIALITLFHTQVLKKQIVLRFIYGEHVPSVVSRYIIYEAFYYIAFTSIEFLLLLSLTNLQVQYQWYIPLAMVVLLVISNSAFYLRLLTINYKRSLSNSDSSILIFAVGSLFQVLLSFVLIVVLGFFTQMIYATGSYISQKSFFKDHDNYYYVNASVLNELTSVESQADTRNAQVRYIDQFIASFDSIRFTSVFLENGAFTGRPVLLLNDTAVDYAKSAVGEIEGELIDGKVNFLVPRSSSVDGVSDLEALCSIYMPDEDSFNHAFYSTGRLIGISRKSSIASNTYRNPLIVVDLREQPEYFASGFVNQSSMYEINEAEWNDELSNPIIDRLISSKTNVYEYYMESFVNSVRYLVFGCIFLIAFAVIYFLMLNFILRQLLSYKSKELLLKTVFGYTILQKYSYVYLSAIVPLALAIVAVVCCLINLGLLSLYFVAVSSLLCFALLLLVVTRGIKKIDSLNLRNVLYGGGIES